MDNTQNQQQPPQQPAAQPQQPVAVTPAIISPVNREHGPVSTATTSVEQPELDIINEEVLRSSHPEVKVPQELEHIVEKGEDASLDEADKRLEELGVQLSSDSTSSSLNSPANIQLPMTYDQALVKQKRSKVKDSIAWLAALIMYQWKKINPKKL